MKKSLEKILLQSVNPVIISCVKGNDFVYAETCIECSWFKSWSFKNNRIEIICKKGDA